MAFNKNYLVALSSIGLALFIFSQLKSNNQVLNIPLHIIDLHSIWAAKYNKYYSNPQEQQYRIKVFYEVYNIVLAHNQDLSQTFTMELNQFSDMTDQEINVKYSAKKMHQSDFEEFKDGKAHTIQKIENEDLVNDPVVVDWRTANILPPILNQGNCGSCWTFAAEIGRAHV